jgi:SAM-dependent methyltransferase
MAAPGRPHPPPAGPPLDALGRAGDAGALAHYADPAYYEVTYRARREDVEYYAWLAKQSGGPVLEYGIGNGRIAIPIARAGIAVHGVDLSKPMLASLRQRLRSESASTRARVTTSRGDMRHARLRRRFPLVIATFNTFLHLYDQADVEEFLTRVRSHLAPGGRFVFDYSVPHADDLARKPDRAYGAPRLRHPTTGQLVRYAERFAYDPIRQIILVTMEFTPVDGGAPWSVPLTHRQFFPQEIQALLGYNGFGEITCTADFTDQPPGPDVDSMVVSCRVKRRTRARPGPVVASRRRST